MLQCIFCTRRNEPFRKTGCNYINCNKKDQDRCDIQNWRAISLLNFDTKRASKVIAERMKSLLPKLIHYNQSEYIPSRNISENIHSILDVMDYTSAKKLPEFYFFF